MIEIMLVANFPDERGWGYDGALSRSHCTESGKVRVFYAAGPPASPLTPVAPALSQAMGRLSTNALGIVAVTLVRRGHAMMDEAAQGYRPTVEGCS
ncbi:hypothetical protein FAZ78_01155 [Cereibacter changlensis]|uniref:Uncharacterized protein n=1 Tax=Cereibacter changlensis TaxID=402884 RepID=A0A4U0YZL8_9RHOB|nr:hypothetical protein [Cereibacter changlensis]TKA98370.1 hypothetical protein FAZ78_01155 [Cereibacter changlensis]